jgi:hypothetical protein
VKTGVRFVVLLAVGAGAVGLASSARASGPCLGCPDPGTGTLTQDISFPGLDTGITATTAGGGTFEPGSARATVKVLLPAYTIPNAGGGQDENHVVAIIRGHVPGYWIVGAKVVPFSSNYDRPLGTLVVWLNKPAETPISFSYMEFGIFQD